MFSVVVIFTMVVFAVAVMCVSYAQSLHMPHLQAVKIWIQSAFLRRKLQDASAVLSAATGGDGVPATALGAIAVVGVQAAAAKLTQAQTRRVVAAPIVAAIGWLNASRP